MLECDHPEKAVRYRVNAAQQRMWCFQCLVCGLRVGDWLSKGHPAVLALTEAVMFDDDLKERGLRARHQAWRTQYIERQANWRAERDAELAQKRAAAEARWQEEYATYRASPAWQALRMRVFTRANGTCEGCGIRPATEVHHLSYEHMGNEFLWELRAVCRPCHARWHDKVDDYAA